MSAAPGKPLDGWSRRRAAVRAEEEARARAEAEARLAADRAALEQKSDAEILAELDLPDPETLGPDDDFSGFMAAAVPERLRRQALRVLWRSDPVLANVDGLVDYGGDYTKIGMVQETIATAYEVGRGLLKKFDPEAEEAAEAGELETPAADPPQDTPPADAAAPPTEAGSAQAGLVAEATGDSPAPLPGKRRMRFEFEQTTEHGT